MTADTVNEPTLRLHFTAEDVLRTRVLHTPDPMWELVLSLHLLRNPPRTPEHHAWRTAAAGRLADPAARQAARLLTTLVPAHGNFPDFLTPDPTGEGVDAALDAVRATPRRMLATDMAPDSLRRDPGSFGAALGTADRDAMHDLTTAMSRYFDLLLRPHWERITRNVAGDGSLRSRQVLRGGPEALLGGLGPMLRWNWPTLQTRYMTTKDVHLGGRGILLVPSFFCVRHPVVLIDSSRMQVLVYPAQRPATGAAQRVELADVLPDLGGVLGHTRTRILVALQTPHTTTTLAGAIGMSLASASQQVALLRQARLVRSARAGQAMTHALTAKGRSLLDRS